MLTITHDTSGRHWAYDSKNWSLVKPRSPSTPAEEDPPTAADSNPPPGDQRHPFNRRQMLVASGIAALGALAISQAPAQRALAATDYVYPTSSRRVSDNFQAHRARDSVNPGTDYVCNRNTPVVATRAGTVTLADASPGGSGGRMVIINHGGGVVTEYLHFQAIQVGLRQVVSQGQQIGLSGGSGYGSDSYYGPHLHISLKMNGTNVDFENYVGQTSPPPPPPEEETADMPIYELVRAQDQAVVWYCVDRIQRYAIPDEGTLADYQYFIASAGQDAVVKYPVLNLNAFGRVI